MNSPSKKIEKIIIPTEKLTRIRGHFQHKYGFPIDNWAASALNEMNEGFEKLSAKTEANIYEIREASSKIKGSVRHISFTNYKTAFWYAAGRSMPFGLAIIIASFLIYASLIFMIRHSKSGEKIQKSNQVKEMKK